MKKFNWGWGIFITCTVFILFISSLVYRASKEKIEFVTENYYDKELKFQDQINDLKNAETLPENIRLSQNDGSIQIAYPSSINWNSIDGQITFFKPDNSDLDFEVKAVCDENHVQSVNTSKMKRGWWHVKISWTSGVTPYYFEQKILVN